MQPRLSLLTLATTVLSFGSITAQTSLVLPAEYDLGWGRGSSAALGGNSTRTQMIFAQPFAAGRVVTAIGLRPTAGTVDRASFTADIEIRMSSTLATPGALSTSFAANTGSDEVIVLPRQTVTIPAMPANRSTGFFATIPFTTPFVFGLNGATNINVDLLVYGRSTGASWSTDRAFASASGRVANAGIGCGSATINSTSTGGTYVGGATVGVTLAGAPANVFALLYPSFDLKEAAPGVPLPVDLGNFGGQVGCALLVNPNFASNGFLTDAVGAASTSVTIPATLGRFGVGWQWIYAANQAPSSPADFRTTANRSMWIGPEVVVPNAQYVWDLSNVNNATGNATTDSVPIVQFVLQ